MLTQYVQAYKLGSYTLVAYIGDQTVVEKREETLRARREALVGSISLHTNLQAEAAARQTRGAVPGRPYSTLTREPAARLASLPRRQRSQSLGSSNTIVAAD